MTTSQQQLAAMHRLATRWPRAASARSPLAPRHALVAALPSLRPVLTPLSACASRRYIDRTRYLQTQPPDQRKKGFGSNDAHRRDEFTLDIETEKWRERIGTEMMVCARALATHQQSRSSPAVAAALPSCRLLFARQAPYVGRSNQQLSMTCRSRSQFAEKFAARAEAEMSQEEKDRLTALENQGKEPRWTHGPKYLFDLGKEATGGTTPYEMKDARDTWYSKHRVKSIDGGVPNTGGVLLSSHAVGDNLIGYSDWAKPEFARQPIIRDSFFRSTGVLRDN